MKLEKNNPRHSSVIDSSLAGLKEYWVLLLCACAGMHRETKYQPGGGAPWVLATLFLEARSLTGLELTEIDRK